ncbi:hypothetical protein [Agaribacterium sp. ZY112]|uniref:hypothetical protein n=1 Tax=Agaribacterium sp. ZY112 TaxID=3233574 RepID=UPI003524FD77
MTTSERRKGSAAIPLNLGQFLNDEQRQTLSYLEGFGWSLAFIRRPLFQKPMVIVRNPDSDDFSMLEVDGTLLEQPDIILRH